MRIVDTVLQLRIDLGVDNFGCFALFLGRKNPELGSTKHHSNNLLAGFNHLDLPSGKPTKNYGKSQFSMGKSTINGHFQ